MSGYDDRLKDYVDVKERIRLFYEKWPDGRLVTSSVRVSSKPDGVPRVWVAAVAYRNPEDALPGQGWSWMQLPGTTPYTRGSELENTETSAWGRAIAALGIGIDKSIGSRDEIDAKAGEGISVSIGENVTTRVDVETEELVGDAKREGMVRLGEGHSNKLEARQGPDGYVIGFRLETSRGAIPQVIVGGPAGDALMVATGGNPGAMRDTRATVGGRLFNVKRPGKRSYYRLKVTSWEWGDFKFPADEDTGPEPPADVELAFEAPTEPMGLVG